VVAFLNGKGRFRYNSKQPKTGLALTTGFSRANLCFVGILERWK